MLFPAVRITQHGREPQWALKEQSSCGRALKKTIYEMGAIVARFRTLALIGKARKGLPII
jgi:hypothetical protein